MLKIEIDSVYFIEVDRYNHTLKRHVKGGVTKVIIGKILTTKDRIETLGYFGSVNEALRRYIKLETLDEAAKMGIENYVFRMEIMTAAVMRKKFIAVEEADEEEES